VSDADKDSLERAMQDAVRAVDRTADDEDEVEVPMPPPPEDADQALLAAKKELDEVIKKSQADAAELKDRWLRAAADLENYKKRAGKEKDELLKFANERVLKDILPVLDDLDRTVEAAGTSIEPGVNALLDGVKMVQKKFILQLEKHGVSTFASVGQAFDPNQHEAVQQAHSEVPAGGVAAEARRGFFLNGRLLRPALVVVSLGPKPS
jgi:molecular chaperone GrpE